MSALSVVRSRDDKVLDQLFSDNHDEDKTNFQFAVMATLAVTPVSADDLYKEDKIDTDERIIKPQTISALTKDGLSIPSFVIWLETKSVHKNCGRRCINY